MRFRRQAGARRERGENIVPMINLVFLLLIFFLMTATIAPPVPFPVSLASSETGIEGSAEEPLFLSATGEIAWGEARDEAVFAALGARSSAAAALVVRADREVPAGELARLLARLATLGIAEVELATEAP